MNPPLLKRAVINYCKIRTYERFFGDNLKFDKNRTGSGLGGYWQGTEREYADTRSGRAERGGVLYRATYGIEEFVGREEVIARAQKHTRESRRFCLTHKFDFDRLQASPAKSGKRDRRHWSAGRPAGRSLRP